MKVVELIDRLKGEDPQAEVKLRSYYDDDSHLDESIAQVIVLIPKKNSVLKTIILAPDESES